MTEATTLFKACRTAAPEVVLVNDAANGRIEAADDAANDNKAATDSTSTSPEAAEMSAEARTAAERT